MSLIQSLQSIEQHLPIWSYKGVEYSVGDILRLVKKLNDDVGIEGLKNIAFNFEDPLKLALSMVVFDGLVGQILLLPEELTPELQESFLKKAGTELLLTDRLDGVSGVFEGRIKSFDLPSLAETVDGCCELGNLETNWVIPTSGTTGLPKLVSHTLKSLTRTVNSNTQKGREFRWGLLYSMTRYAGLQVFLQSLIGGSMLIMTKSDDSLSEKIESLATSECNALSATPTMWRKILMLPEAKSLNLKQVTLGGEASDEHVLKALNVRFPESRVVHIYASTEAGVGFVVTDGKPGFPLSYLDTPPSDIEIKISSDGILYLKNRHSTQTYIGSEKKLSEDDGFVCTGDLVELKDERYLFLGRENGAINVGGNKVQPEEIENVILGYPGVKLASISAKKSSITGSLVVADIVMEDELDAESTKSLKVDIKKYCKNKLTDFKVPAVIRIVKDIEIGANGKIQRG